MLSLAGFLRLLRLNSSAFHGVHSCRLLVWDSGILLNGTTKQLVHGTCFFPMVEVRAAG